MEQNLPFNTNNVWNIVRTMFYMLRKGISKGKLMSELKMIIKRGKIAGKDIHNLMFHHWSVAHNHHAHLFSSTHRPLPAAEEDDIVTLTAVERTLEMLNSMAASPAFPGFGNSSMVRQLRITGSPFPLQDVDEDNRVDEAAEKFIMKFYDNLFRQN